VYDLTIRGLKPTEWILSMIFKLGTIVFFFIKTKLYFVISLTIWRIGRTNVLTQVSHRRCLHTMVKFLRASLYLRKNEGNGLKLHSWEEKCLKGGHCPSPITLTWIFTE
jgi:hypothetical protein